MCSRSSFTISVPVESCLSKNLRKKNVFYNIYVSKEIIMLDNFNKTRMYGHVMWEKLLLFLKDNAINNPCIICDTKNNEWRTETCVAYLYFEQNSSQISCEID